MTDVRPLQQIFRYPGLRAASSSRNFIISPRVNAPRKSSERQDRGTANRALLKVKYQYQLLLIIIASIALTTQLATRARQLAYPAMSNMKQTTERALPAALHQNVVTQNDIYSNSKRYSNSKLITYYIYYNNNNK